MTIFTKQICIPNCTHILEQLRADKAQQVLPKLEEGSRCERPYETLSQSHDKRRLRPPPPWLLVSTSFPSPSLPRLNLFAWKLHRIDAWRGSYVVLFRFSSLLAVKCDATCVYVY